MQYLVFYIISFCVFISLYIVKYHFCIYFKVYTYLIIKAILQLKIDKSNANIFYKKRKFILVSYLMKKSIFIIFFVYKAV